MEALGNAKTPRNNNSSRFGKLLEIQFDASNSVCGAHITPYMLETARLTNVEGKNRSFHIFYQLMKAGPENPFTRNVLIVY